MPILHVPQGFATIQAAAAAAASGDTILVDAAYAGNETATVSVSNLTLSAPGAVSGLIVNLANGVTAFTVSGNSDIQVNGNGSANIITGGAGDDFLRGMGGNDRIDGGDGFDWADYRNAAGAVTVNLTTGKSSGADGVDTLLSIERVVGSNFNDTLTGNSAGNFLRGMKGNDTLDGGSGSDWVDYASADGSVVVNIGIGKSSGSDGIDTLFNFENIRGSSFDDTLIGNGGNNFIRGGTGNDIINGGAGGDSADYSGAAGSVIVNLATGKSSGADGIDTLVSIEYVRGSAFGDTLTGNGQADFIRGMGGNDTIDGGTGSDYADYREAMGAVSVNLATGKSSGADGVDTLIRIEGVTGSNFADTLTGNAGKNYLRGQIGNDRIDGGGGLDWAEYRNAAGAVSVSLATGKSSGADGVDTLVNIENLQGSDFSDTLVGNAGNNVLQGLTGADRLTGGLGQDAFYFESDTDGADTITDFNVAADVIHLDNAGFGPGIGTGSLAQAGVSFVLGPKATSANESLIYNKITGQLFYDENGTAAGGIQLLATLSNKAALTAADFLFV